MAFLRLESGDIAATKKFTISLWFRVPSATLAAVHQAHQDLQDALDADTTGTLPPIPANSGMIPLVTFGPRNVEQHEHDFWNYPDHEGLLPWQNIVEIGHGYTYRDYHWDCTNCNWFRPDDEFGGAPLIEVQDDDPTFVGDYSDKSFIGINCRGPSPVFDFRVQFGWDDGPPTVQGIHQQETGWSQDPVINPSYYYFEPSPVCFFEPFCGPDNLGSFIFLGIPYYWEGNQFEFMVTQTWSDRAYLNWAKQPEAFSGFADGGSAGGGQVISGNRWHHVLFSIDMDHEISTQGTQTSPENISNPAVFSGQVNSTARAWLAIDDVNRAGTQLSSSNPTNVHGLGDPNDLLTEIAHDILEARTLTNFATDFHGLAYAGSGGGVRNDTYEGRKRPSYSWTPPNFSLSPIGIPGDSDTVKLIELAQIQVFTDVAADASDITVRRLFVGADGKPVTMGTAYGPLASVPVIAIKGSANWIAGTNTGTGGALDPSGTITEYNDGPSLR